MPCSEAVLEAYEGWRAGRFSEFLNSLIDHAFVTICYSCDFIDVLALGSMHEIRCLEIHMSNLLEKIGSSSSLNPLAVVVCVNIYIHIAHICSCMYDPPWNEQLGMIDKYV